jgi:hypothetical protein
MRGLLSWQVLVHEIKEASGIFSWADERICQNGKFKFRVIFFRIFEHKDRMNFA